jgi:GDSL-like Lipase/Acylhydrolase family
MGASSIHTRPRNLVSSTVARRINWVSFVVAFAVGILCIVAAALAWQPFDNLNLLVYLEFFVVFAVHGVGGQLSVSAWAEWQRPDWTRFGAAHHVGLLVAAVVTAALLVGLDIFWIKGAALESGLTRVYVLCALAGFVIMGVQTHESLRRRHVKTGVLNRGRTKGHNTQSAERSGPEEETPVAMLAILTGMVSGILAVVLVISVSSWYRQTHLARRNFASPTVNEISGRYFALGDSYASGEGLGPFLEGTDTPHSGTLENGCHRSKRRDFAIFLSSAQKKLSLGGFVACSGAVTADIYTAFNNGDIPIPAQADGKIHADVRLVTIMAGGNDILFPRIVAACFEYQNCLDRQAASLDFPSAPSKDHPSIFYPVAQHLSLRDWLSADMEIVGRAADALYHRLRHDFPRARIVVVGYPYLFPSTGSTAPNDCLMFLHRFTSETRAEIRRRMDDFNNILYERAVAQRIDFVSPATVWTGHEPCGRDGEFTNGIKPFLNRVPVDTGSFHPNAQGQHQLASLVACYLNAYPGESAPNLWTTAPAPNGDVLVLGKKPKQIRLSDAPGSPGGKRFDGCGVTRK